jgi:hypothetical protein
MQRLSVSLRARAWLTCLSCAMILIAGVLPAHAITKRPPSYSTTTAAPEEIPAAPEAKAEAKAEAKPEAEAKTEEPAPKDESRALHEALDRGYRFSKHLQSEFGIFGGDYLGDEWYNTWDVGARYYLHLNNSIALGAEYFYSPIRADSTGTFGQSLRTDSTHTATAAMMYSNDTAFRAGDSVVECDLFLTVGGGAMQINRQWQWTALIGGGLKIYTGAPWFAVRFDVNSYLHPTPKPGGDSFNADLAIQFGASFLFPTKKIEAEKASASAIP